MTSEPGVSPDTTKPNQSEEESIKSTRLSEAISTNNSVIESIKPCEQDSLPNVIGRDKAGSLSSSSTNKSKKPSTGNNLNGVEDDEFYDAVDSETFSPLANTNFNYNGNVNNKILVNVSNNFNSSNYQNYGSTSTEPDQFFDTKTSRHPSEMSDVSMLGPLSPRVLEPSILVTESVFEDDVQSKNDQDDDENDDGNETCDEKEIIKDEPCEKAEKSAAISDNDVSDTSLSFNEDVLIKNERPQVQLGKDIVVDSNENDLDETQHAFLETEWSFWLDRCIRGTTKDEYEAGLKLIYTFNTVQKFWSVFNNIPDVSVLPNQFNYHLMRQKRRPLWEDKENSQGGLWKLKCKKEDSSEVWRELLLATIGEQVSDWVSPNDDIVGVSVGRREKDDVIQIWNQDYKYSSQAIIIRKLQELVPHIKFSAVFYKAHFESFSGHSNDQHNNNSNNTAGNKSYHNNHPNSHNNHHQNPYNNININHNNYNYHQQQQQQQQQHQHHNSFMSNYNMNSSSQNQYQHQNNHLVNQYINQNGLNMSSGNVNGGGKNHIKHKTK